MEALGTRVTEHAISLLTWKPKPPGDITIDWHYAKCSCGWKSTSSRLKDQARKYGKGHLQLARAVAEADASLPRHLR